MWLAVQRELCKPTWNKSRWKTLKGYNLVYTEWKSKKDGETLGFLFLLFDCSPWFWDQKVPKSFHFHAQTTLSNASSHSQEAKWSLKQQDGGGEEQFSAKHSVLGEKSQKTLTKALSSSPC